MENSAVPTVPTSRRQQPRMLKKRCDCDGGLGKLSVQQAAALALPHSTGVLPRAPAHTESPTHRHLLGSGSLPHTKHKTPPARLPTHSQRFRASRQQERRSVDRTSTASTPFVVLRNLAVPLRHLHAESRLTMIGVA